MRDHTLIGKFLGLWPSERCLIKWINTWWKLKGHFDLQLESKGFFPMIFENMDDKEYIFENGPYFLNSDGI
jgi:hypothetical protein